MSFPGVTFLAAAGDNGSVNNQGDYPADSPNVVAVGGTSLTVDSAGNYANETVWHNSATSATGGGTSNFENQPIYQKNAEPTLTKRTTPDVAFDANPNTGAAVYDSFSAGGGLDSSSNIIQYGGTSLATPCWAGLVAIANQIRASQPIPEPSLTGATQTLPILYNIYGSSSYLQDFHDITSGGNGTFNAAAGYDEVSGIGTPAANNLVPALADVNQLLYMAPSGTNSFLLQASAGNLNLYNNNNLVASNPLSQTTSVFIAGAQNNSLAIDTTGLPANLAVTFDGGPGTLAHSLTIQNNSFTNESYTYTGANSGTIALDGLTVGFTHVTASANTTTGANFTFNLPSGAQATLQANGTANDATVIAGFFSSTYNNPTTALTVNTAGGSSVVNLAAMIANFTPATETLSGHAGDSFVVKSSAALPSTASMTLNSATLDLHGFNPVIDALAGNGTITDNVATASTLTIGFNNDGGNFAGAIQNGTGTVALTKVGSGTETLTGISTYTGATIVTSGALQVNGSLASSVTVQNLATLYGTGGTGPVSVQNGGALDTAADVSNLTTASLNLLSGSTFNIMLDDSVNYSRNTIASSGTVSLDGADLVLSGNLVPVDGQTFTLINNNGSQPVSGTFDGLPEGAVIPNFLGSDLSASITYVGGDGNDVVLYVGTASATTVTAVSASAANTVYGQGVTFTATVTVSSGTPAGNVEFYDATTSTDLGMPELWPRATLAPPPGLMPPRPRNYK